jgi:hypothetical protein
MPAGVAEGAPRTRRPRAKAGRKAVLLPASIVLRHPRSGEGRRIKVGFAWDLFLFAGAFGVPLFLRGLHAWGAAILALWLVDLALGWMAGGMPGTALQSALFVVFLALQLWLGLKGNALTARLLLERGWTLDQPEDAAARRVVERWRAEEG